MKVTIKPNKPTASVKANPIKVNCNKGPRNSGFRANEVTNAWNTIPTPAPAPTRLIAAKPAPTNLKLSKDAGTNSIL